VPFPCVFNVKDLNQLNIKLTKPFAVLYTAAADNKNTMVGNFGCKFKVV
jgi:hypothetical protein